MPPSGQKRFSVVVEGADAGKLLHAWTELCQAGEQPPSPEFRAVYPFMTTVQGNRFRFRGGDPPMLRDKLQHLLQQRLGGVSLQARTEG